LTISEAAYDDDLICVHLPDFSSLEVGPVMSLLYFGEIWLSEACADSCRKVLDTLQVLFKNKKVPVQREVF
jgi:hypothetical protein